MAIDKNKVKKAAEGKGKGKEQKEKPTEVHDIEVLRAHVFDSGDIGFDASVNGITLYGMTYIDVKEGRKNTEPFISFPSYKGKNGQYYNNYYFPVSDADMEAIEKGIEGVL